MVRATHSGVSAIVDATGAVVVRSGVFREETLHGEVAMMSGERTVFALLGHWPAYLAAIAIDLLATRRAPARLPH